MKNRVIYLLAFAVLFLASCSKESDKELDQDLSRLMNLMSPTGSADYYIMPESSEYNKLPNQDPNNPITAEKVALGKKLFFETGLAQIPNQELCYETYSCSSCHLPEKGFLPGAMQGIADGAAGFGHLGDGRHKVLSYDESDLDAQGNRPMTVMNVTYMTNTLWSGTFGANDLNVGTEDAWHGLAEVNHTGYAGLEAQNIEGFDLHRLDINDKVLYEFGYAELFDKAFPDFPEEERYSPVTASFAMGAYLRSILTNKAPFQDYLKGNTKALTNRQKEGAIVFYGKAGCVSCHSSPSFSSMNFFALGTKDMYEIGGLNTSANDERIKGRGMFTGNPDDDFKFKVPQLYNLKDYVTFFHGSSKTSIEDVIDFKVKAKSENPFVQDSEVALIPRDLSDDEKYALADFLRNALHDNDMLRYKPKSIPSGYCFPNNDHESKKDMGCN